MSDRLWKVLERCDGLEASAWSLKNWLGEEFRLLPGRFFRETSRFVSSIAVEDQFGCVIPFRIVEHGPRDVAAVDREGDRITIAKADCAILEVDHRALARSLAEASGFDPELVVPLTPVGSYRIGQAAFPLAGPVIACLPTQEDRIRQMFVYLQGRRIGPTNVILISRAQATEDVLRMAETNGCHLIYAKDAFDFGWETGFAARKGVAPPLGSVGSLVTQWPLDRPQHPAWREVVMRFPQDSSESVHIRYGRSGRRFEFREIGQLVDNRSGRPNGQWVLLRAFAARNGKLDRLVRGRNEARKENVYRHREKLAKALMNFFDLSDDPFIDVDSETVCRFEIGMKGEPLRGTSGEKTKSDRCFSSEDSDDDEFDK